MFAILVYFSFNVKLLLYFYLSIDHPKVNGQIKAESYRNNLCTERGNKAGTPIEKKTLYLMSPVMQHSIFSKNHIFYLTPHSFLFFLTYLSLRTLFS